MNLAKWTEKTDRLSTEELFELCKKKDGVIDVCQIGQPLHYRIDDGGAEFGVRADGNNMAWMNQFRVQDGAMVIEISGTSVQVEPFATARILVRT